MLVQANVMAKRFWHSGEQRLSGDRKLKELNRRYVWMGQFPDTKAIHQRRDSDSTAHPIEAHPLSFS